MVPTRTERALERIAEAEERRNELLEEEAGWRREAFARDQAEAAKRWAEIAKAPTNEATAPTVDLCPLCGSSSMVRLASDWSARVEVGERIPIVGCGNPWHYVGFPREEAPDATDPD